MAAAKGGGEGLRAGGVFAEVYFGLFDGLPSLCELGEASPGGVDVAVVADCLREVGGAAGDERHRGGGRVGVGVAVLFEKAEGDAGVRQEAHAARRGVEFASRNLAEDIAVDGREKHRAAVVRAGEVNDFGNGFHHELLRGWDFNTKATTKRNEHKGY